MDKTLESVINELIENKTFTLEAVEAIKKQRDELISANDKITSLNKTNGEQYQRIQDLTSENNKLSSREQSVFNRETTVAEREKKATELEITSKYQRERGDEMKGLIQTMFTNTLLRKSFTRNISGNGSTGAYESKNENGTEVIEEV
jgi:uncharacterized protein (DUF3084 family)